MSFLIVICLLAALIGGYILCHNGLVNAALKVDEGWSGIVVQLKRRHELVPNLVDAARTAMNHESSMLDRIVDARLKALLALANGKHEDMMAAEGELSAALRGLVGYSEDNPEITATENIQLLQKQLEETEDQIAASRRLYNGNVQAYNSKILSIPWNFVAKLNKHELATMFEVDEAEMSALSQPVKLSGLQMEDAAK